MTLYCMLFTYSPTTWQRLVATPEDRSGAVDAALNALGGRLVGMYYMLGPHDGLVIAELPGAVSGAAVSALVCASGAYSHVETHALLTPSELVDALGRAGAATSRFVPPGASG